MKQSRISVHPVGLPESLARRLAELKNVNVIDDEAEAQYGADALLYWPTDRLRCRDMVEAMGPRLRWVHIPWVGVEKMMQGKILSGRVMLTNSRGAAGSPAAEYVLGAMLCAAKEMHLHIRSAADDRSLTFMPTRELRGRTVLIVGLGDIGRSVARLARSFGMKVIAVTRTPRPYWACSSVLGTDALNSTLSKADYVVLAVPSTEQTRSLFNESRLSAMQAHAWLINVGRGDAICSAALSDALLHQRIGGAVLDVTDPEPLPQTSPLWRLPNAILTPHVSTWTEQRFERAFNTFESNVSRFSRDLPLFNQVLAPAATKSM